MARLPIAFFFSSSRSKNWSSLALSSVWAWLAVNDPSVSKVASNIFVFMDNLRSSIGLVGLNFVLQSAGCQQRMFRSNGWLHTTLPASQALCVTLRHSFL